MQGTQEKQAERILEGCHVLLQGLSLTQGSNPHLLQLLSCLFTAEPPRKLVVLISGSQSVIWGVLVFSRSAEMDYHKL